MDETSGRINPQEFTLAGLLAVGGANIGWGLADVCISIIGRGQVITWIHGIMGAIFLGFYVFFTKEKFVCKDFKASFPIGLQRTVVWSALFIAFQDDNPSIGITVISFSLVVSIVVFGPRLGEKLTPRILILAFIGTIGLILTSVESFTNFTLSRGAVLSLLVLPIAASGTYVLRNVQKKVPVETTPMYMYMWIAILASISIPFFDPKFSFTNHEILVLLVLMVFGAGGHIFFNYSQQHTSFRFNAIASTIHNPSTAIFAWWLVSDTLHLHQIVGMIIVTVVVAYMSVSTRRKAVQELEENLRTRI